MKANVDIRDFAVRYFANNNSLPLRSPVGIKD